MELDILILKHIFLTLPELEHQLADQKEEIAYYREYIDPKHKAERNVLVRSFKLYASVGSDKSEKVNPREFFYKLVESKKVKITKTLTKFLLITKKLI